MSKKTVSESFIRFAETECRESSPFYEQLALQVAHDDELLQLSRNAQKGQPIPNLLFGAVHYVLLNGTDHELKAFYPSMVSRPKTSTASFKAFKHFCMENYREIVFILQTKIVQTNEVRRCAYLYPAFGYIYERVKKPLALIEIGTSAGLQLIWDKFAYSYDNKVEVGAMNADWKIDTAILGENKPYLPEKPPPVISRTGIDIHIMDLNDKEQALWLKALIWPEHKERLMMFEKAASQLRMSPVNLVEGDGVDLLDRIAEQIPMDSIMCIYHTHVANQMSLEKKENLMNKIEKMGQKRDVFHLYNNIQDRFLHLDYYLDGCGYKQTIAETDGHGRWFRWLQYE